MVARLKKETEVRRQETEGRGFVFHVKQWVDVFHVKRDGKKGVEEDEEVEEDRN